MDTIPIPIKVSIFLIISIIVFISASQGESDYEACIKNFNVDLLEPRSDFLEKNGRLLTNYFLCRSVFLNDIKECYKISDVDRRLHCISLFGKVESIYGRLIKNQDIEGAYRAALQYHKPADPAGFKLFLEAILSKNSEICDKMSTQSKNFCLACIKGEPRLCSKEYDRERAEYITALRKGDIRACNEIRKDSIRIMCRVSILNRPEACEEDEGFKKFREFYCSGVSKKGERK